MPRTPLSLAAALLVAAVPTAQAATPPVQGTMSCTERSGALLDNMVAGHFAKSVDDFDAKLAKKLSPETMKKYWGMLTRQAGDYRTRGMPSTSTLKGYTVITTPMTFSKMTLNAQVACNGDGKVAGLHFLPASTGKQPVSNPGG